MRAIDGDKLVEGLKLMAKYQIGVRQSAILGVCDTIRWTPTIDAVPVVRCKDCIHRHESEFCECRDDDAFCSDGERKLPEKV